MKIVDSFKLSMNSILHRRLRSWLTLLGIVIGVAAVVAIISIGEGAQSSISQELSSFGADIITVSPGYSKTQGFGGGFRAMRGKDFSVSTDEEEPTLTEKDSMIIKQNQNVKAVLERTSTYEDFVFLSEEIGVSIKGVNANTWQEVEEPELATGRFLTPSDSAAIVISGGLAEGTFKQPITLGRRVKIGDQLFTVVGILKEAGSSSGMKMFGSSGSKTVYMTNKAVWNLTDDETLENNTFTEISVKVKEVELVEQTMDELIESLMLFRKVNETTRDFSISSVLEIQEQISGVMDSLTLFLGAIAGVSLVVGAVGVANSMFTSVLEKTKLIGILKALGSTNTEILTIFIIESGLFGLLGGIIGVILGSLISSTMTGMMGLSLPMMRGGMITLVTPELMIIAITLSTLIGITSGIMPARAASKLKPVEALRYE